MELNVRKPYFKDARVRQAIYHAIDRDFLLKNIWFNFGKVATGPISSDLKNFYTPDVPRYEFSIAKANQLLDAAGLTRDASGVRLRITHNSNPFGGENNRRISAYFKQQMDLVGIRVDIRAGDTATSLSASIPTMTSTRRARRPSGLAIRRSASSASTGRRTSCPASHSRTAAATAIRKSTSCLKPRSRRSIPANALRCSTTSSASSCAICRFCL